MQTKSPETRRDSGMSLVEVLVSMSIFGLVLAGSIASAMLFAKVASEHENQSDFSRDLRIGLEQLSLDARNASGVRDRQADEFTLSYGDSGDVVYSFNSDFGFVMREVAGESRVAFSNVVNFDVLVDAADASSNPDLEFSPNQISVERMDFNASSGTADGSSLSLSNLSFTIRNG